MHLSLGVKARPEPPIRCPRHSPLTGAAFVPHRQNQPGHGGPGGPGQRKLCAYPEPGGPSSCGLSPGAGGYDLLSCFLDTFAGCLWEVSSSSVSPGKRGPSRPCRREKLGRKAQRSPLSVNVVSSPPGSRLWSLLPGLNSASGSPGCENKSGLWRRNPSSFRPLPGP